MNKKGFTLIELLGVIILLGIISTMAIVGYSSYLSSSKNKAFAMEEQSFISSTRDAFEDCISNKPDKNFCNNHSSLETKYTYQFVYLKELIDDDYIGIIKNPYNVEQVCDIEKSYVYVGRKNNETDSINSDIVYKACLICGNNKSKDCLDDDADYSSYDTTCKAYYDTVDGELYDGKWTDRNVILEFAASGNYRYGINEYTYTINDSNSYNVTANSTDKAILTLNKDVKNSNYKVYALDGMNKKGTVANCGVVKVDKGVIDSVSIIGKTKSGANVTSDKWTTEEVVLTANVNPSSSASGYLYQWYLDGEKYGEQTDINTLTVQGKGSYQVEVTNKIGKIVKKSDAFIVKVDTKVPTCTLKATGTLYNNIYISDVTIDFDKVEDKENENFDGSGVVSKKIDIKSLTTNEKDKVITGTVTDGVGRIGTCSITITRDNIIPEINAKSDENKILNTASSSITNFFDINFGPSGGSTICKVGTKTVTNINELTLGINTVTCTATGNNGKVSSATTKFIHQYYASASCSNGSNLSGNNTTCTKSEKTGTTTSITGYHCNDYSGYTLSGTNCIKTTTTNTKTDTKNCTCTLNKQCTIGTVTGKCIYNGNAYTPCYSQSNVEINSGLSACNSNCNNACTTSNSRPSCTVSPSTSTDRYPACGTETAYGSSCANAKKICPTGYTLEGTTCNKYENVTTTDTKSATPITKTETVYTTRYYIPTYTCSTVGTNTENNKQILPEISTVNCPSNQCSSVPICTFKEV